MLMLQECISAFGCTQQCAHSARYGSSLCTCRLDTVVDASTVSGVVLKVMPACPKHVQQSMVDLLPELVPEQDCEASTQDLAQGGP